MHWEISEQRTAHEQREWETLQTIVTARLADKDELIASLQQQTAEPPNDPDAPLRTTPLPSDALVS